MRAQTYAVKLQALYRLGSGSAPRCTPSDPSPTDQTLVERNRAPNNGAQATIAATATPLRKKHTVWADGHMCLDRMWDYSNKKANTLATELTELDHREQRLLL